MNLTSLPLLLAAAASVGVVHSVLPDHWIPLAVVARANRWSLARTARVSFLASLGHVAASLVLGAALAVAGLALRRTVMAETQYLVGGVLVLTGLGILAWSWLHPHTGHDHAAHTGAAHAAPSPTRRGDPPDRTGEPSSPPAAPAGRLSWLSEIAVPFGVAASPDLTILPVFFAASTVGLGAAIATLVAFSLSTVVTFVVLTVAATLGGYQVDWPWLERNGHLVSALVLVLVGVLIFARL